MACVCKTSNILAARAAFSVISVTVSEMVSAISSWLTAAAMMNLRLPHNADV
jgi:hypothetical protein